MIYALPVKPCRGVPPRRIERGELYALAKTNGFSEQEVYRYAMDLDLSGYLKAQPILGEDSIF